MDLLRWWADYTVACSCEELIPCYIIVHWNSFTPTVQQSHCIVVSRQCFASKLLNLNGTVLLVIIVQSAPRLTLMIANTFYGPSCEGIKPASMPNRAWGIMLGSNGLFHTSYPSNSIGLTLLSLYTSLNQFVLLPRSSCPNNERQHTDWKQVFQT